MKVTKRAAVQAFLVVLLAAGIMVWGGCSEGKQKHPPAPEQSKDTPGKVRDEARSAGTQPGSAVPGLTSYRFDAKQYNVLLITIDTLRYDRLSIYSHRYVKTPNIDRLARKSVVFTRAFSHNPVTLPAHTNILTGTTPRYHGISDNTGFRLHDRFLTIAEFLKEKNYRTSAFIGAFPLDSRFGLDQGFDVYDDNYGTHNTLEFFFVERKAEDVITPALQWLGKQSPSSPWFSWIHLFDPHQPYLPPSPFREQYKDDLYSGEVAYLDAAMKRLFDFLESSGRMQDTVIIITGDHGEALGEKGEPTHSYFAYNNTIHIPLIMYVPGATAGTVHKNVAHVDIFPTLCQLLDAAPPAHLQGQSVIPLIEGKERQRPEIYFESLTPYLNRGWAPLHGFVRGHVKFIDLPIREMYDLEKDMDENGNLAAQPQPVVIAGKNVKIKQLKRDLVKLKLDLKGKHAMKRSEKVDPEVRSKLKSLGYLSSGSAAKPKTFTEADDLKTLLPLQNRMLAAVAKYQAGQYRVAIKELNEVIEKSPGFTLVYRHLATIYKETGRVDKAVEILETGLKKNPGNINLMSKLGIMLAEANRPGKAVELLKYCIKMESHNPENYNFLGVAYYKKGDFAAALENYRKALELDKNYASVFNNVGSLYLVVFTRNRDEKAYQLAMEHFDRALRIDPRLFAAYNGRGAAYKFKKQNDLAIADWKKTIEINPNFIDAYFNLGVTLLEKGDKAQALGILTTCRDRFKDRLPARALARLDRLIAKARQ